MCDLIYDLRKVLCVALFVIGAKVCVLRCVSVALRFTQKVRLSLSFLAVNVCDVLCMFGSTIGAKCVPCSKCVLLYDSRKMRVCLYICVAL